MTRPITLLLIGLAMFAGALHTAHLGANPLINAVELSAWLAFFIAGVAGISWVRCVRIAYVLYLAQQRQRASLDELAAQDGADIAPQSERELASRKKRRQSDGKLLSVIELKIKRNDRARQLNHRLQVISLSLAALLLVIARVA